MLNSLYQLSKHCCMGNVMKFLSLYLNDSLLLSCHGYHAPLVLGKDIPLKYVCIHIFLPIVLIKPGNHLSFPLVYLNPFYDLYDINSNNSLLVQTPWCTTRSVRPCYFCWWHSGNHLWTRTLPFGPPCSTSRKMVLFIPSPWYRCCCRHNRQTILWHALLTWSCKMSPPFLLLTHMVGP